LLTKHFEPSLTALFFLWFFIYVKRNFQKSENRVQFFHAYMKIALVWYWWHGKRFWKSEFCS
jgi:hypothetical protein